MTTWRRALVLITLAALSLTVTTQSSSAQDAPVAPGVDQLAPGEEVVQSWALFPAGNDNPDLPGNRPNLTYNVAAGTSIDDAVTVANYGNVPLLLRIYARDAFNNADGGFDILKSSDTSRDAGSWVSIVQENIAVPPQQQYTIPITIAVPLDASPGDHAAAIVAAQTTPGTGPDGKTVTLERRTGTRVYVRVDGPLIPELAVENLQSTYTPSWNPLKGTTQLSYRIQNRGNVRLKGTQQLKVGGVFGIAGVTEDPQDLPELLPGQGFDVTRTVEGVPATVASFTTVQLNPQAVVAGTDDELPSDSGRDIALAMPWLIIAIVAIVLLAWYARRSYKRRQGGTVPPAAPPQPPVPQAPVSQMS